MTESTMETLVVKGHRSGMSARILITALQELVYASQIIEIALNALPRDAKSLFIAQVQEASIEGEGITRRNERKRAIEAAISVMGAYPLSEELKAAGWPKEESFVADQPMPPRWARLIFTGSTMVVATFGFDAFASDEQYFIRLTVQRGTGELEHMEHYYADPLDQASFDTVAATQAQEFVRFLQEYGGDGNGLRTLEPESKSRRCAVCSTVLNPSSIELCQACRQDYPGDSA